MSGRFAQPTHAPVQQKPAHWRRSFKGSAQLTVTVGDNAPVVLGDVRDRRDWERVLASLRFVFESEEARAEGWSTADLVDGFRALRGSRTVTFLRQPA